MNGADACARATLDARRDGIGPAPRRGVISGPRMGDLRAREGMVPACSADFAFAGHACRAKRTMFRRDLASPLRFPERQPEHHARTFPSD